MPYLLDTLGLEPGDNFTAVIFVQIGGTITPNTALYKLVKSITKSQFVDRVSIKFSSNPQFSNQIHFKIIILWASDRPIPSKKRWPNTGNIPFHLLPDATTDDR